MKSILTLLFLFCVSISFGQIENDLSRLNEDQVCKNKDYVFRVLDHDYLTGEKVVICSSHLPLDIELRTRHGNNYREIFAADISGNFNWTNAQQAGSQPYANSVLNNNDSTTVSIDIEVSFQEVDSSQENLVLEVVIERDSGFLELIKKGNDFAHDENYIVQYDEFDDYQPNGLDWYFLPTLQGNINPNGGDDPAEQLNFKFKTKLSSKKILRNLSPTSNPDDLTILPPRLKDDGKFGVRTVVETESMIEACSVNHGVVFSGERKSFIVDIVNVAYNNTNGNKLSPSGNSGRGLIKSLNKIYKQVNVEFTLGVERQVDFLNLNNGDDPELIVLPEQKILRNFVRDSMYGIANHPDSADFSDRIVVMRVSKITQVVPKEEGDSIRTTNGRATTLGDAENDYSILLSASSNYNSTLAHEIGHALFGFFHPRQKPAFRYDCDMKNLMYWSPIKGNSSECNEKDNRIRNRDTDLKHYQWKIIHQ